MDFIDPKKKKIHRTTLFVGYGLMAIAISLGTAILVLLAYGYDFDRKTGSVIQNGLVFIQSNPVSADVYVNGERRGDGNQRLVLPSGEYAVELQREGYRSWQRDFFLEGGSIKRFVYPFLFPNDIAVRDIESRAAKPSLFTASPDRRWLVIGPDQAIGNFQVIDLNNKDLPKKEFRLPAIIEEDIASAQSVKVIEWSNDNSHLLLQFGKGADAVYILMNHREPEKSIQISRLFQDVPFSSIALRDKKIDEFFLYNNESQVLSIGRRSDASVRPYVRDVIAYATHGEDVVLYVTKNVETNDVELRIQEKDTTYFVREMPDDTKYLLNIARFDGQWTIAAASAKEKRAYIYRSSRIATGVDPLATQRIIRTIHLKDSTPLALSFSQNTRNVLLHGGNEFAVYDAETDQYYSYTKNMPSSAADTVDWMDGHRITAISDGNVLVFDFDGSNEHSLTSCNASPVRFDRDYTAFYCFDRSASDQPLLLRRNSLRAPQDEN
jgi:hypothetical protein